MPRCAKANIEDYRGRIVPRASRPRVAETRKLLKIANITNCWANDDASFFLTNTPTLPNYCQC